MFTPEGWPQIHKEAQGFNLVLGLVLGALAHQRTPGWAGRFGAIARASLAERACMASWSREAIVNEFSLERLVDRARNDPQGGQLVRACLESIPGPAQWWRHGRARGAIPAETREQYAYACACARLGDERANSSWTADWAAIDCALALHRAACGADDLREPPQDFFLWAQARLDAQAMRSLTLLDASILRHDARPRL